MIEMYASAAIALVVAGALVGILVMLRLGLKRDDRPAGFPADTDDRIARATRRLTGAGARRPELAEKASNRQEVMRVRSSPRTLA
jgi:hypothetical protein